MKEINKIILKEKQKNKPNKDYIQWLQQLSDQNLTANFIYEVKQKKFLEDLLQYYIDQADSYNQFAKEYNEFSNSKREIAFGVIIGTVYSAFLQA